MKIRSGFVTNSSSSSFLVFNVKNPELYQFLISLGLELKNTEKDCFNDGMEVVLPNGEQMNFYEIEPDWMPAPNEASSISGWLMSIILAEIESLYPAKELEDYTDFTLSLVKMLNEKGITDMDVEDVESWDRDTLLEQLHIFDKMDANIEEAEVEFNTGFEGEILHLEYLVSKNGYSLSVCMGEYDEDEEETLKGANIYLAYINSDEQRQKLIDIIEKHGGCICTELNTDIDYVVCDDLDESEDANAYADNFCIPVVSSKGFLYRFRVIPCDEDDVYENLFECTYDGAFYEMFYRYGIGKVTRLKLK